MEFIENKLFTLNGRKRIGDVNIGDKIVGNNGSYCNVMEVHSETNVELFKITFNDGYSLIVDGEHLCTLYSSNSGENHTNRKNKIFLLTTKQMLDKDLILKQKQQNGNSKIREYEFGTYFKHKDKSPRWQIPIVKPIGFNNFNNLPIEPYLLGLGLGDGHFSHNQIKFAVHKDDYDELFEDITINELKTNVKRPNIRFGAISDTEIKLTGIGLNEHRSWDKFIPDIYKYSSIENRISMLQGLMDTDGYCVISHRKNGSFGGTEYSTVSEQLANDVAEIVHSLGGIVRMKSKIGSYTKDGVKHLCRRAYRLNIKMPAGINPFRIKRKADIYYTPEKYKVGRYIKNIESVGFGDVVGILTDSPDNSYITEYGILTHDIQNK